MFLPASFRFWVPDHIEFWIGKRKSRSAYYYQMAFGFKLLAYAPVRDRVRDRASYAVPARQDPSGADYSHASRFGGSPGTYTSTATASKYWPSGSMTRKKSFYETMSRGRKPIRRRPHSRIIRAEVKITRSTPTGGTIHTFAERKNHKGAFMPGLSTGYLLPTGRACGTRCIDPPSVTWNSAR